LPEENKEYRQNIGKFDDCLTCDILKILMFDIVINKREEQQRREGWRK